MKKNKLILSLFCIFFLNFIQSFSAFKYTIDNKTGKNIILELITSPDFSRHQKYIAINSKCSLKIGGKHERVYLDQINVYGEDGNNLLGTAFLGYGRNRIDTYGDKDFELHHDDISNEFTIQNCLKDLD